MSYAETSRGYVLPLQEVPNLVAAATSLDYLLTQPANEDIGVEFPSTVAAYTGSLVDVVANLQSSQARCVEGVRQHNLIFNAAGDAVGMSVVVVDGIPREGIDPLWPNASVLVCAPYRRQGLGVLSLAVQLEQVDHHFGGCAWTSVDQTNEASQHMVEAAGFNPQRISEDEARIYYNYTQPDGLHTSWASCFGGL